MGDGTAEYSDDHKDAIAELFNQVMGAYTGQLAGKGTSASHGSIDVKEFDVASAPFDISQSDMSIMELSVGDNAGFSIIVLIPDALSKELMSLFGSSGQGGDHGGVGLNAAELDDLSKVSSGFSDSPMSGGGMGGSSLGESSLSASAKENIEMLLDVDLDVCIELGRAELSIKRILELAPGSIVELDRLAGEPVDLMVNSKVVAKGEVVVVDESFGIRIVSLVSPEERIKSLK
jgi:flagellar motor switch protein FliN/FliY